MLKCAPLSSVGHGRRAERLRKRAAPRRGTGDSPGFNRDESCAAPLVTVPFPCLLRKITCLANSIRKKIQFPTRQPVEQFTFESLSGKKTLNGADNKHCAAARQKMMYNVHEQIRPLIRHASLNVAVRKAFWCETIENNGLSEILWKAVKQSRLTSNRARTLWCRAP